MSSKKITIFPYMLARVGGFPFSILNEFRLEEEEDYQEKMILFQKKLQELSHSEILLKGVVQTSESFFERIIKFQNKPITSFRKKEFQTQRSLFQYLARTVGKTSPFSTLTTLSPFVLENNVFENIPTDFSKSNIQYNNQLFLEIKNWILDHTDIHLHLNLVTNSTIKRLNNEFLFLENKDIEQFKRIETSEVIDIILGLLTPSLSFQQLVNELLEVIDAEETDIVNYVSQLVELGFLEFVFPNIKGTSKREEKWLIWLQSFPRFKRQDELLRLFNSLINSRKRFQEYSAHKRISIKRGSIKKMNRLGFEQIPMKYLFYEDVGKTCNITLTQPEIEPILSVTHQLAELIEPLMYDKMQSRIYSFFEKEGDHIEKIDLLEFYEQFLQQDISESEIYRDQVFKRRNFWKKQLEKLTQLDEKGNVNLTLKELNSIHESMDVQFPRTQLPVQQVEYLSGHFQFVEENNKTKGVLNGIAPGHGKLFGRFNYFFPTRIIQELKEWNSGEEDEIWIQNNDATIFNANGGKCFFQKEITIQNSNSFITEKFRIEHLELRWDASKRKIELWEKELNKRVKAFDTGVVEPSQRSLLFQILKIFGAPFLSVFILTDLVNELLEETVSIKNVPRITIDGKLIIQRKGKIIPRNLFYKKAKKDSKEVFFRAINEWRKHFLIPDITFVKQIDATNHKPQLIDFKSPLSVLVFEKILNSGADAILFNEMLPAENQLEEIEGEKYCTEFVLQWKKHK